MARRRDRLRLAESSLYSTLCRRHGIEWNRDLDDEQRATAFAEVEADIADRENRILELGGTSEDIDHAHHMASARKAMMIAIGQGAPFSRLKGVRVNRR